MKTFSRDQRGMTMVEILISVAIFAIISATTVALLLYCIKTNSFVMRSSSTSSRSHMLNGKITIALSDTESVSLLSEYPEGVEEEDVCLQFLSSDPSFPETFLVWDASEKQLLLLSDEQSEVLEEDLLHFTVTPVIAPPPVTPDPETEELAGQKAIVFCVEYTLTEGKTFRKVFSVGHDGV